MGVVLKLFRYRNLMWITLSLNSHFGSTHTNSGNMSARMEKVLLSETNAFDKYSSVSSQYSTFLRGPYFIVPTSNWVIIDSSCGTLFGLSPAFNWSDLHRKDYEIHKATKFKAYGVFLPVRKVMQEKCKKMVGI